MICYHCGMEQQPARSISREQICRGCGAWLHCCLNCVFYSETAHHHCRESEAEFVQNKKAANFCEFFRPGDSSRKRDSDRADEARKKLNDLFGG
ncbi:hypothetical protein JXO52_08975 [bacterium]|nr:hypothetical protein [bacterium]